MPTELRRSNATLHWRKRRGSNADVSRRRSQPLHRILWYACAILALWSDPVFAQDVTGDLNTNIGDGATVDSNNATDNTTNNYNSGPPGAASNPVPSAIAPTVMGGGGNDSCLIPNSRGVQISIIGVSEGKMTQDPECNRRKDARLLGSSQQVGGLGLQVSGISVMCAAPHIFKAMALASTPCPIFDVDANRLLTGRDAFEIMRRDPKTFVVGYAQDRAFWDAFLRIGRKLKDVETIDTRSVSDRFRSSRGADVHGSSDGG